MLSAELNKQLTETGPGTPCGDLLRHYWQPAALSEELDGPRPAVAVRLMGEDLVLFKDEKPLRLVTGASPSRGRPRYGRQGRWFVSIMAGF